MEQDKAAVQDFWSRASCGEVYALGDNIDAQLRAQAEARYELEPFIHSFADFDGAAGKRVLEVGVGMGADHHNWATRSPELLAGVDLTQRAVQFTRARLAGSGLGSLLGVGDAEQLPFSDNSFDIVYSWGVLHHSPNTRKAISEVHRVLKPGGRAAIMVYHRYSIVGFLLWLRYGLIHRQSLTDVYARHLESPGTKAYTVEDAIAMFENFSKVTTSIDLSVGDLMLGAAGQRHSGILLSAARALWPRPLFRRFARQYGLFLMVTAVK